MNPCTNEVTQTINGVTTTLVTDVPSIACLEGIITNIIGKTFLFLGIVTIAFLFYGAVLYVISQGDPKGIEKAQKTMTYAIIGAAVVIGSFIIVEIVLKALNLPDFLTGFTLFSTIFQ